MRTLFQRHRCSR